MRLASDSKIKDFLKKIGGADGLASVVEAVAGAESLQRHDGSAGATLSGAEAVGRLERNVPLDEGSRFHLEAIIIPDLRPAIRIDGGDFKVTHASWLHLNQAPARTTLQRALSSIGRIELPNHPTLPFGGTGFVVGDGLLMTNRHVAEIFASGTGRSGLKFHSGLKAGVDFRKENEDDAPDLLVVSDIALIHPYWDMALLRVSGLGPRHAPLVLSLSDPDDLEGRDVAVIGYPAFDPRNSVSVQNKVFDGVYNVKRLQPGKLRTRRSIESYDRMVNAMTHDSSTLGGNSGSAIVDVATGAVVGLHFAGLYLDANFGVPASELARDARVVDAGVLFAGTPVPGPNAADAAWSVLETRPAGPDAPPAAGKPASATFELPIRITVEVGAPVSHAPTFQGEPRKADSRPAHVADATERMVEPFRDRDYATRSGYDAMFLGVEVPFPEPADGSVVARMANGAHIIPYHHFSVVMHERRRLALITGANVDANPARKRPEPRPDADYSRDGLGGLGKNDQERWFTDERLRGNQQLPDRFFEKDRKSFDKGHLVRREDVAWGSSYDELRHANGDTFHVTNCSPQIAGFNRAKGENWGALENEVMRQARTEKLNVFSAPVLDDGDRLFKGLDDDGVIQVPIPTRYWKVIVAVADGRVESFGFVLEQDLGAIRWEFAVPEKWTSHMRSIGEIETMAGIRFPDIVRAGDQRGLPHGEAVASAVPSPSAADAPVAGTRPIDAVLDDLAPIMDGWRAQQDAGTEAGSVRMALNFAAPPRDGVVLAAELRQALRLELVVEPMFEPDPDLDRYWLLTITGVSRIDRPDLFDLARLIREITRAASVDPDLGTDYFDWDPPDAATRIGPESSDIAFWCWADEVADKPIDSNWAFATTGVKKAWDFSVAKHRPAQGKGITVFQPDTGVVANHPELGKNLHLATGAGNFVEKGKPPLDPMKSGSNPGHGTGTGSVIVSDVGGKMSGVAPLARLVPVRCIESVAVFDQSPVAQAIDHARSKGAHIITMSLGGLFSDALHAAVRKAVSSNIIVIAAAGNCVTEVVWPARYAETIAVAGTREDGKPWRGSCRGGSVAISGPAELVLRADPRQAADPGAVTAGQGTSFAAAHLAGVAALWLAHHGRDTLIAQLPPGRTLQDAFRAVIRRSARVPAGFDTGNFGAGIINAEKTLKEAPLAALAASTGPKPSGLLDQLTGLLDGVFGSGTSEAAVPALVDRQNYPEIACAAFDRLRAGRSVRAAREAMPPIEFSSGLRAALGETTARLARVEIVDER